MKKTLLASLILTGALSLSAQESKRAKIDPALAGQKAVNKQIVVGADKSFDHTLLYKKDVNPTLKPVEKTEYYVVTEEIIGESFYDLQTNASVQNRLIHKDGTFSAVWTQSKETNEAYNDRGTGYNYYDGSEWGDLPDSRIETVRTGWPSIAYLGDGEAIVSHTLDGFSKVITREDVGSGNWSESNIGNEVEGDIEHVWHRMKVGGENGQTIHIIANPNVTPEGDPSIDYIEYTRSTDGGASWDKVGEILPGIGSDDYTGFGGDNYAIDTRGDIVAFVLGGGDKDVILMKSEDNGDTWTKTIILEFPIPMFNEAETLIDMDTPGAINVNEGIDGAEEVWAIETADGSYSISIDADGNCHVFYGNYRIANDDLTDGSTSYFPVTDGLMYWNEANGETEDIAGVIDLGGDETLNVENADRIATYFTSLTSFPNSYIAADGTIYLTYSGIIDMISEEQADSGDEYNRHYRHQYLIRSTDNGDTWSEPIDLMAEPSDPLKGDPFMEGVYGNVVVDEDNAYILYQRDDQPGVGVRPDEQNPHGITENQMIFATVKLERFNNISVDEIEDNAILVSAYPNPANNFVTIQADVNTNADVTLELVNTLGQTVYSEVTNGNTFNVDLSGMETGVYFYTVTSDNFSNTNKLIIK